MEFVDSHCHLDAFKNYDEVISKALKAGVKAIVTSGCSGKNNTKTLEIAQKYPEHVFPVIGIAPQEAMDMGNFDSALSFLKDNKARVVGVGEIGLDFRWGKTPEQTSRQRECFELFLEFALSEKLPLVVHSREAEKEVLEVIMKRGAEKVLLHCFSGDLSLAETAAEHGFLMSVPPVPSRGREKIVKQVPLENLLLETDAPYLGGEPAAVNVSARMIADIKGIDVEEVSRVTTKSCIALFNLRC
ncbi:MAG: TatD family hydrolase [Candidatus Micrarchaeota archaeon]|nr:TatD family hydrolase [Candidatus Micrarchaeota archaeon]